MSPTELYNISQYGSFESTYNFPLIAPSQREQVVPIEVNNNTIENTAPFLNNFIATTSCIVFTT